MLKIITGTAKGKILKTLEGEATRPTSERIKEAVFSSIQFDVENRRVLDLFAGCGQLGLGIQNGLRERLGVLVAHIQHREGHAKGALAPHALQLAELLGEILQRFDIIGHIRTDRASPASP